MTEPHHAHLAEMRRAVADVRYAAKEIDTRAWLATVPHLAPPQVGEDVVGQIVAVLDGVKA